ncbi:MAG: SpoIID/LytB domain-containing protein, partial [Phycisphaerales bacterium]
MDIDAKFWVRVLLLDSVKSCTFKTAAPFDVSRGPTNPHLKAAGIRFDNVNVPVKIGLTNGRISVAGQSFLSQEVVIFPDDPHIFTLDGKDYRGNLRLIVNADGSAFDAINLVPPEPYLAGVIGAEMPDYWEAGALRAQAIAARTYCFYIKNRFGVNRNWDVKQTEASQVYRGLAAESARVWRAVNQTTGQMLVCKHPGGDRDIFPAYYSSTCGGHTEDSVNVFGDSFEPLTGVPCPYCEKVATPKFFFWPMIRFSKAEVQARLFRKYPVLKKLGKITRIIPADRSDYEQFSRLTRIKLVGSNGESDTLRAEDFRLAVDPTGRKLKSSICKIMNWD